LSTIEDADRIVVLDDGHIVEIGSHAELLAKQRNYARLPPDPVHARGAGTRRRLAPVTP
jgi:ABC-type transport system involved in cytochrome bd biosynthesis fused ATPase/permease subunit